MQDGFIVGSKEFATFISNYELTTEFNYAGKKFETDKETIVMNKKERPFKGIILMEDVTFAFKSGDHEMPKGSILYANPKDEDGYWAEGSANLMFRVAAAPAVKKSLINKLRHK